VGVIGQPQVTSVLLAALSRGRPHHAYLFDGPEGVGKATCARALFAAMNCLQPEGLGAACGSCASCSKLAAGTHPDFIVFDMTLSGLAEEAERVIRRLQYPPFEGRAQLVLFDPADQFTAPTAVTAANRLLKTLEEPRPATHFVLVTTAASSLLPTLRSRCQRLRFSPLADAELTATLRDVYGASEEDLTAVAKLAQGSLGRSLRYLQDREQLGRCAQAATDLYAAAKEGRATRVVEVAGEVGGDREQALEALDLLWLRLHDDLKIEVHGHRSRGVNRRSERLLSSLRAVRTAQQAIRGYTGAPLSLERMLRHLSGVFQSAPPVSISTRASLS
jgi:DNA polymerase-3 subunit delta'